MKYIVPDKHKLKHKLIERNNGSTDNSFISLLSSVFFGFPRFCIPESLPILGSINVQLILLELL